MVTGVTVSLIVTILETSSGTMTSLGLRLGSGDITVLAVKLDLFPERFCRNRPCFPLSLLHNDLICLYLRSLRGSPGVSPLIY